MSGAGAWPLRYRECDDSDSGTSGVLHCFSAGLVHPRQSGVVFNVVVGCLGNMLWLG